MAKGIGNKKLLVDDLSEMKRRHRSNELLLIIKPLYLFFIMAKATKHQLMHSKKCWVVLTQIWVWSLSISDPKMG